MYKCKEDPSEVTVIKDPDYEPQYADETLEYDYTFSEEGDFRFFSGKNCSLFYFTFFIIITASTDLDFAADDY